jgi:hypothetical protein
MSANQIISKESLPLYQSIKKVRGAKIALITGLLGVPNVRLTLEIGSDQMSLDVGGTYVLKHNPTVGGYYVLYEDGYESFSPADAFEKGNVLISDSLPSEAEMEEIDESTYQSADPKLIGRGLTTPLYHVPTEAFEPTGQLQALSECTDIDFLRFQVAQLYNIIDDISTVSDIAKNDDVRFRKLIEQIAKSKNEYVDILSDGIHLRINKPYNAETVTTSCEELLTMFGKLD